MSSASHFFRLACSGCDDEPAAVGIGCRSRRSRDRRTCCAARRAAIGSTASRPSTHSATRSLSAISAQVTSLWPRWLFLRALGLIFFSAFYSLAYQIHGLIGARGILPADYYLHQLSSELGPIERVWYAPPVFWMNASNAMLTAAVVLGLIASVLLVFNVWPRLTTAVGTLLFLSCIGALQAFSSYHPYGMLLEAGFLSLFFAPRGIRPGLGIADPPSRFSLFMLRWGWFRIYFESGLVEILSGDPTWRDFTAMDNYYQNGPLPSWMGWDVQPMPHRYYPGPLVFQFFVELLVGWAAV